MKAAVRPTTIKGRSLEEWETWLTDELTPPKATFASGPQGQYVLQGMLELVRKVRKEEEDA